MRTILYTVSTLRKSGPGIVLKNLVSNLDRTKFKPVICTLSREVGVSIKEEFEKMQVPIYCLNKRGIKTFIFGVWNFRKLVKQINPHIIHANNFRDILLVAFFLPDKYKKFVTVHCDWAIEYKLKYNRIVSFISIFLEKIALRLFDCRIAVSSMLADLLNNKYPEMHFSYVNNGVDTLLFSPAKDKIGLRKELKLPLDKKIIIWVGAFSARKDPLTMVKAILQLPENEYFFLFIGVQDGLYTKCIKSLVGRKDVKFIDFVTNLEEYFKASDIYISTSLSEGFHLTVYEAMACGLPVILTDIKVYENLKNSSAVLFYPPKNEKSLIAQLKYLFDKNNTDLSAIAREIVEKKYSAHNMALEYMKIYEAVI